MAWLTDQLADGPKPSRELIPQAKHDGITEKTLRRAKDQMGVVAEKQHFSGQWVWCLPNREDGH